MFHVHVKMFNSIESNAINVIGRGVGRGVLCTFLTNRVVTVLRFYAGEFRSL